MEDIDNWGKVYIPFGKYTTRTLSEVCEIDPDYCLKILRNNPEYPEYKAYIDKHFVDDVNLSREKMEEMRLPFNCVTGLLKQLQPYHYIRLYNCFRGYSIIHTKQVHESSSYTDFIIKNKLYSQNGVFYDYLIRKHIFNLQDQEAYDSRASKIIELLPEGKIFDKFSKDYKIFMDKKNQVLDILPNIFGVSLLHLMAFGEEGVAFNPEFINLENLKNILSYLSSLPYVKKADLNPELGTVYFTADADMVTQDTIIDFKVSKFPTIRRETFLQLICYAVSYYIHEKKEFRRFVIYNPLLGLEHTLVLENLDFQMLVQFFEDIIIKNFEYCDDFDFYNLHSLFS